MTYHIIIDVMGVVYKTKDYKEAEQVFQRYVARSKAGKGKIGNEPVFLITDQDDIILEYDPEEIEP
jgi:hypothetical protein